MATRRFIRRIPMTRFSISEDEDDAPITFKRPRFSDPASSQSQPQSLRQTAVPGSPSHSWVVEEEEQELIPIEDVESDSQELDEDEEDEDDELEAEAEAEADAEDEEVGSEDDDVGDHGEEEPVPEGQNQQQQMTSVASAQLGQGNVTIGLRRCNTAASVFNNATGPLQVTLNDPDVLDCPICLDPLCAPVFQCENGHIACSSCCSKVKRKCPSCCMPIGYNRCRAIEQVIDSIRVSCKNARYGCKETMSYSAKNEHEQSCPHATCYCPQQSCPFAGSSKNLYLHFGVQHATATTRFTYNTIFTVCVEVNEDHMFLQEQHDSVIFVLNHEVQEHGRAFNIDCIGPSSLKGAYVYQLTSKSMETSVSLQSVAEPYTKWSEHNPRKNHLTVPSNFSGYRGLLTLQVCIKKASSPT